MMDHPRICTIRTATTTTNAIASGRMPIFTTFESVLKLAREVLLESSFWISKNKSRRMPINTTDPAIAEVAMVDTVDVVTVDIITEKTPIPLSKKV